MSRTGLVAVGTELAYASCISVESQVLMPEGAPGRSKHWFLEVRTLGAGVQEKQSRGSCVLWQ